MLRKLIKYDMKALSRTLPPLHIFVAFFALIGRTSITGDMRLRYPTYFQATYLVAFLLLLVVISVATHIIIGVRFYENLFSAQGYLSWTLPVTAKQHLLSKLLVAFLWHILSFFLLLLAFCIFFLNANIITSVNDFLQYLWDSSTLLIPVIIITTLLSVLAAILTLFASATIGQLFAKRRIIASIVAYGIFSLILQFAYTISMLGIETSAEIDFSIYYNRFFTISLIAVVRIIIFYAIIHYITKRKLNLV